MLGLTAARKIPATDTTIGGHILEGLHALADVMEYLPTQIECARRCEHEEAIGIRVGQGPEQHAVRDAENRCRRADAKGQGEQRRERKCRRTHERAQSVSKVLKNRFHLSDASRYSNRNALTGSWQGRKNKEGRTGQTKPDLIVKNFISLKESRETRF